MVVLGVSCIKELDNPVIEEPSPFLGEVLTVVARAGGESDTKTAVQPDGTSIYWTPGDAINLFYGSGSAGQFTTTITEPSQVAEFTGTLSVATGSTETGHEAKAFWAVYPYNAANTCDGTGVTLTIPGEQGTIAGSFADKLNPTVATSPGLDLAFYNVGSWFIFSVTQEGVTSATFRGNSGEDVAGTVRVSMNENSRPVATVQSGIKSITITPPEGRSTFAVGEEYYIVLLPQTMTNGYTLTLRKDSRHVAECVVSTSATFSRSMYRRKRNADNGLTYSLLKPEMVDLGLPSGNKWASFNVGATTPEEYGDYFAWGETEPKTDYSWETYKYGDYYDNLSKYVTNSYYGTVDNLTELLSIDDAAQAAYGSNWYTPTKADFEELLSECTWARTYGGFTVTGQNGNSIFLPAAGYMIGTDRLSDGVTGAGLYATSTLFSNNDHCESLYFYSDAHFNNEGFSRDSGLSIRPVYKDLSKDYLTFHILSDGSISFKATSDAGSCTIYYSKDCGSTWTELSVSSYSSVAPSQRSFSVSAGDVVMFKGSKAAYGDSGNDHFFFGSTCRFSVSGNIMSLINGSSFETLNSYSATHVFHGLFASCTNLVDASKLILPVTTLTDCCYYEMFSGCTSLTQGPKLPSTSLANECYRSMFSGCSSLAQAPVLSATTLDDHCYYSMFSGCSSLTQAPTLPATTLADHCYYSMFSGCSSLTQAPTLPATTLADHCYYSMFSGCSSLTQAPTLPVTTLADNCYSLMFRGCSSLAQAPTLPATILTRACYQGMFMECTSLVNAPELPATQLVTMCYQGMFYGCSSLSNIKCLAINISASYCTTDWTRDVSSTGTFVKNPSMTGWTTGNKGIPSGWTVTNAN